MYSCKQRHMYYILTLRVFFQGFVIHTALENNAVSSDKIRYGIFNLGYSKISSSLCRIYRKSYSLSFQCCGACCQCLAFPSRDFCVASSLPKFTYKKNRSCGRLGHPAGQMRQNSGFSLTCTRNQVVFLVCLMLQFHMIWKLKGFIRLVSSFLNHPSGERAQRHLTPLLFFLPLISLQDNLVILKLCLII